MTETKEIKTASINILVTGKDSGRDVLLVGLKDIYRDKPQYQKALKREFAQCHKIDHPNILKYLEEKEAESQGPCIVMEWQEARTFDQYLAEGHSGEEKKRVIRQVADALSFLHQNGLVHGALTPSCIFITTQADQVKILNFRLKYADLLSEPVSSTRFRAPEAKDGTVTLDARTDIYSLGMLLKDMNMGTEYENVISTACSVGRFNRYPDVDSFLEAFEHRRVSRRPSAGSEGAAPASNKKMAIFIATIVALAVAAAVVFFNRDRESNETVQPATEAVDSVQTQGRQPAAETASDSRQGPVQETHTPEPQPDRASGSYTGNLEFLNTLLPQMHIDLDKIYASTPDKAAVKAKVSRYYKGLRRALGNKTDEQFAAYDKAFADYISKKNAE